MNRRTAKVIERDSRKANATAADGAKMDLSDEDKALLLAQLSSIERQVNSAQVQINRLREAIKGEN